MEKITLPIEEGKEDTITPSKPDFTWAGKMIFYSCLIIISIFIFFYSFSYFIVGNISIEREQELLGSFYTQSTMEKFDISQLSIQIDEFKKYDIYIQDSDEINAFATPGANVFLNKGLLNSAETEEEITFILAHEIGHIENRHILKRFSLQIPFTLTLEFLGINMNLGGIGSDKLIGNYFSRQDEQEADNYAVETLNKHGINLECATYFFKRIKEKRYIHIPEILSTHPTDNYRIENIKTRNKNKDTQCKPWKYKK